MNTTTENNDTETNTSENEVNWREDVGILVDTLVEGCKNMDIDGLLVCRVSSVVSYVHILLTQDGWKGKALHTVNFVVNVIGQQALDDYGITALKFTKELFVEYYEGVRAQSFDGATSAIKMFSGVLSGSFLRAIKGIIMAVCSFGFFGPSVLGHVKRVFGATRSTTGLEMLTEVVEHLGSMFTHINLFKQGLPFTDILMGYTPVSNITKECVWLSQYEELTYTANVDPFRVDDVLYEKRLFDVLAMIKIVKETKTLNFKDRMVVLEQEVQMRLIASRRAEKAGEFRKAPTAVFMVGPPGIGKTLLSRFICKMWAKCNGREWSPSLVYNKNPLDEFWSGLKPTQHKIIQLSEIASESMNIVTKTGSDSVRELLRLVDGSPYRPNMASLDDKGRYLAPELVIADGNNLSLHAEETFLAPSAARRRFFYVEPLVLPKYRKENSMEMDSKKAMESDDVYTMNRYSFNIYQMVAVDNNTSEKKYVTVDGVLMFGVDIFAFTKFLNWLFTAEADRLKVVRDLFEHVDIEAYYERIQPTEVEAQSLRSRAEAIGKCVRTNFNRERELYRLRCMVSMLDRDRRLKGIFTGNDIVDYRDAMLTEIDVRYGQGKWRSNFTIKFNRWKRAAIAIFSQVWVPLSVLFYFIFRPDALCNILRNRRGRSSNLKSYFKLMGKNIDFFECCMLVRIYTGQATTSALMSGVYGVIAGTWFVAYLLALLYNSILPGSGGVIFAFTYFKFMYNFRTARLRFSEIFTSQHPMEAAYASSGAMKYALMLAAIGVTLKALSIGAKLVRGSVSKKVEAQHSEMDSVAILRQLEKDSDAQRLPPVSKKSKVWETNVSVAFDPSSGNDEENTNVRIMRNMRVITIVSLGLHDKTVTQFAMGLYEDVIAVNFHAFESGTREFNCCISLMDCTTSKKEAIIRRKDILHVVDDLALFRFPGALFRDIRSLLYDGDIPQLGIPSFIMGYETRCITAPICMDGCAIKDALQYTWPLEQKGKCGTPLIGRFGNKTVLLGIHCAGKEGQGYAMRIKPSLLSPPPSIYVEVNSQSDIFLPPDLKWTSVVEPHHPMRYVETPCVDIIGGVTGRFDRQRKSTVRKSILYEDVESLTTVSPCDEYGMEKYGAPVFGTILVDGEYRDPYKRYCAKAGSMKPGVSPDLLEIGMDVAFKYITDRLGPIKRSPLPMAEAINGQPDNVYWRGVNWSTASGYTFHTGKRKLIHEVSYDWKEVAVDLNDEVKTAIAKMVGRYARHENAHAVALALLKDEVRSSAKIEQAATRVFCGGDLPSLVLARMYLGPIYSLMISQSQAFGCALGINTHGVDANTLAEEMLKYTHFLELDYKDYDTGMSTAFTSASNTLVYRLAIYLGYNEIALRVVRGILSDSLYMVYLVKNLLYIATGVTPSGKYGTAEDNSIKGLLLLICGFITTATGPGRPYEPYDFEHVVLPRTYGDDVIAGVAADAIGWFNNLTYSDAVEAWGMKCTSAAKNGKMSAYLQFHEISFLKRKFVFSVKLQRYTMPIELDSVMKSLAYIMPSRVITADEQYLSVCNSALRELYFHFDNFTKLRESFIDVLHRRLNIPISVLEEVVVTEAEIDVSIENTLHLPVGNMCAQSLRLFYTGSMPYAHLLQELSTKYNIPYWSLMVFLAPFTEDLEKMAIRPFFPFIGSVYGLLEFVLYVRMGIPWQIRLVPLMMHCLGDYSMLWGFIAHLLCNWGSLLMTYIYNH